MTQRALGLLPISVFLSLSLAACGDDDVVPTVDAGSSDAGVRDGGPGGLDAGAQDAAGVDAAAMDAGAADSGGVGTDAGGVGTDAGGGPGCGTMRPDVSGIRGTEGLVIARDGTIYYSQARAVGRLVPGGTPENGWASLGASASVVWGLALDAANEKLYAGSQSASAIFRVDVATAAVDTLLPGAGAANGLTMGADGALWYSDFSGGHVYRVDVSTGTRTRVTAPSAIRGANGVAFGPDGRLYVDSYETGTLIALTLTGTMESGRATVAMGLGNPDGLGFDASGRIYVGDNAGRLIRLDADGTGAMTLRSGIPSAANVEFGAGPLVCTDIYVASGGTLVRYEMGTTAGAAVPWH